VPAQIVFTGEQFPATRQFLRRELPDHPIRVYEPGEPCRADVLIALMARIDGAYMDRFTGLRVIHQWGTGLEGVRIPDATARGIAVGNVAAGQSGNAGSVAEWCLLATLSLLRRVPELVQTLHGGKTWGVPVGTALAGRTAGIVGMGGIGTALARRLRSCDVEVVGLTAHPSEERRAASDLKALHGPDGLEQLLATVDLVYLCVPVDEVTRGLIGRKELAMLRPHAILVNPGRGPLLDHEALLEALDAGTLGGAGLDVFETEPVDPESPLVHHPRVFATPHIAGVTDTSYGGIARRVADMVRRLDAGLPLEHCVNWPDVAATFYDRT
jgi:phosphoglycerate dehydrogenase-like enzyme